MLFLFRFFERCGRRFEVEVIWKWRDVCLAPTTSVSERVIQQHMAEGRKKITLKWRERAIIALNRDELKRSTTSSLLSPPASPLSTPTIILCFNLRNNLRILPMSSDFFPVPSGCRLPFSYSPQTSISVLEARSLLLPYILPITQYLYSFVRSISTSLVPSSKRS